MTSHKTISFKTRGDGELVDLSAAAQDAVAASGLQDGICTIFVGGSTAAVTTIEYEPGLSEDFPRILEQIAPRGADYAHDRTWGDGNGYAHVRAALIGPSVVVPFAEGRLLLGRWQQPVLVECDNRSRQRHVQFTVMGE